MYLPGHGSRAVLSQAHPEDFCYEFAEVVFALLDGGVHAENSTPFVSRDDILPESFSDQGAMPSATADGSSQVGEIEEWELVAEQEAVSYTHLTLPTIYSV